MNLSILGQRLKDLEENINADFELLKEYESALRYTTNPPEKVRYKREIATIRESANRYQQEYDQLTQHLEGEPTAESQFSSQLSQISTMLEMLLGGQRNIRDNQYAIRDDLAQMHQALLNRYDVGERAIVASIAEKLDQNQIVLTQSLLDGISANQISESEMQDMLAVLEDRLTSVPNSQTDAVLGVLKSPEVGFKHKLKVAIPLIPQLLPFLPSVDYEGELELGTGFDVKVVWEKVKAKLRGK